MTADIPQTELSEDFPPKKDIIQELGESQIRKFFADSTILITGGTGFLGKLLIEKLLRSCPELKKIYVLARPKKNKDISKRLKEQFEDVLYEKLKKQQPDFMKKVIAVAGDVTHIGLGMSEEDRKRISNEVEIIFHGAATVRFDEPLKSAVQINVRGTRELLVLGQQCPKLRAFVHVSTAYSNCNRTTIEEKVYDSPLAGDKLIDLVETIDENIINNITPGLMGDFPNTYVFTKAVAENIVTTYGKGLPVAIFRPAIVVGTYREPVTGWIDNVYGPTGVVVGAAVGLLHVIQCNPNMVADLVPGDMVVNATIATAWKVARDHASNHEDLPPSDVALPIYNYISSEQKPLTWRMFMNSTERCGLEVPTIQAVWSYMLILTSSKFFYSLSWLFFHWIPAYVVDGICALIGKKPILKNTYKKIEKFSDVMSYFSMRQWKFHNKNTQDLYTELCDADKQIYNFNIADLDWNQFFFTYIRGIRFYLLKDPVETVPAGVKKHYRLKYLNYACFSILGLILLRLLWGFVSFFL